MRACRFSVMLGIGKITFPCGVLVFWLGLALLPTYEAGMSSSCTKILDVSKISSRSGDRYYRFMVSTWSEECMRPSCVDENGTCFASCRVCVPSVDISVTKLSMQDVHNKSTSTPCTVGVPRNAGQQPATCWLSSGLAEQPTLVLLLTMKDKNNLTLEMTSTVMAGEDLIRTHNSHALLETNIKALGPLPLDNRIFSRHKLFHFTPPRERKPNVAREPGSEMTVDAPSIRLRSMLTDTTRDRGFVRNGNSTVNVTATPPDELPTNLTLNFTTAIPYNPNSDSSYAPYIFGPSQLFIKNVSVYLIGVLLNQFQIMPPKMSILESDESSNSSSFANYSLYVVQVQAHVGYLLISLPPRMMPNMSHQITTDSELITVSTDLYNRNFLTGENVLVPGAGIMFKGSLDECNMALATLTFSKTPSFGKYSYSDLFITTYPTFELEPELQNVSLQIFSSLKTVKRVKLTLVGGGAWFTIFHITKRYYTSAVGIFAVGSVVVITVFCCCGYRICWQRRKENYFKKQQTIIKSEDELHNDSRVFNPYWVPSAGARSDGGQMVVTANPKVLQQRQSKHINRMKSLGTNDSLDAIAFLQAIQAAEAARGSTSDDGRAPTATTITDTTVTIVTTTTSSNKSTSDDSSDNSAPARRKKRRATGYPGKHRAHRPSADYDPPRTTSLAAPEPEETASRYREDHSPSANTGVRWADGRRYTTVERPASEESRRRPTAYPHRPQTASHEDRSLEPSRPQTASPNMLEDKALGPSRPQTASHNMLEDKPRGASRPQTAFHGTSPQHDELRQHQNYGTRENAKGDAATAPPVTRHSPPLKQPTFYQRENRLT